MRVIILHGILGYAGENWSQWLHDELIKDNYTVDMPSLPNPDKPDRQLWLDKLKSIANSEYKELIIVGHSIGVTTALDYIEQSNIKIKALISVSGISEDYNFDLNTKFLSFKNIDFNKVNNSLESAFVFYGDNDPYVPQEILKKVADNLNVKPIIIHNGGHLNASAGFTQFPQVLDIIRSIN